MGIQGNREQRRAAVKYLKEQNQRWPEHMTPVPRSEWPANSPPGLLNAYRSRRFFVQVFNESAPALVRLSVNRTGIDAKGGWTQDIPWEDLQRIKAEVGYGDCDAVEVFPRERDVVNVADMRHLWVMAEPLSFAWGDGRRALR